MLQFDDSGVVSYLIRMDGGSWGKAGNVTSYTWESAISDGNHSFEVRAVDNDGNEGSTASLKFLCDTAPPARPMRTTPVKGYCTDDTTPSFDWSDVSDPSGVSYRLQIGYDSDFSLLLLVRHGLTSSQYTLTGGEALADGTYYWRVCAVDGRGTRVSGQAVGLLL